MEEPFNNNVGNNENRNLGNVVLMDNTVGNYNEVNNVTQNTNTVTGEVNVTNTVNQNDGVTNPVNTSNTTASTVNVPVKVSTWSKIKAFLFQEIRFGFKPKTEVKLQEAHNFWHQDVTTEKVHSFLFQKIKFGK